MTLDQLIVKAQELLNSGNTIGAIEIFKKISPYLENDPGFLDIFGTSYLRIDKKEKGIAMLHKAHDLAPKNSSILYNLGKAYNDCEDFFHAKKYLTLAYQLDSENILVLNLLGAVLTQFGKFDKAYDLFLKVLKINPNYFLAFYNLGLLSTKKTDYLNAIKNYEKAIAINPNHIDSIFNLGLTKLLMGDYEEGWKLYEIRLKDMVKKHDMYDGKKAWRGEETINSKTLLLYGEQGFGDVIQFSRYVPFLTRYKCKLILYVQKELVSILKTLDKHVCVVGMDKPVPMHDFHCPIMSLPFVFKTNISNIPSRVPYLTISKAKKSLWQKELSKTNIKKIGIVFSGSKIFINDRFRSIDFKYFETFFKDINSVEFHSLMVEYRDGDKEHIKKSNFMISHEKDLIDFSDTAALISSLDLVISVDSVVAHLAGAMNKPVWILIPYKPDFRWMLDTSDSLWYPSAKLFRQKYKNDWSQPLKEINLALKDFVKAGTLDS